MTNGVEVKESRVSRLGVPQRIMLLTASPIITPGKVSLIRRTSGSETERCQAAARARSRTP